MRFATQREAERTILRIEGELDALTVPEIRAALDALVAEEPKHVVIDLTALRLIDSSGVGAIVSLFKRLRAYGGGTTVVGVTGQPLAIFQVLRLDRVFTMSPSL